MDQQDRLTKALAHRYTIEREIGSGGMATVYLAQDLKHKRQVAVKVLKPELAESLGPDRFLREIETVANLAHPHILPLHDSGEVDGFLFFVMPFVRGDSLRIRLTKEKQLPIEEATRLTREIASALAYAHEEGVIHRDVKPGNIMLEAGHAVLADFGVAHAVTELSDDRITRTGTSVGTPAYMSPEQVTGERSLDQRSDQYALGCVLYEMLAGQPPFTGPTGDVVVRQHLTAEPPNITAIRPGVPTQVVTTLERALSKTPADRFDTTGQMMELTGPFRRGDSFGLVSLVQRLPWLWWWASGSLPASSWPARHTRVPRHSTALLRSWQRLKGVRTQQSRRPLGSFSVPPSTWLTWSRRSRSRRFSGPSP
jgi:serine/threonine-protein kinase